MSDHCQSVPVPEEAIDRFPRAWRFSQIYVSQPKISMTTLHRRQLTQRHWLRYARSTKSNVNQKEIFVILLVYRIFESDEDRHMALYPEL